MFCLRLFVRHDVSFPYFCLHCVFKAAVVDVEQGQVNLGIMAGERRAALAKVAELLEQKRHLARLLTFMELRPVNRNLCYNLALCI